jgi:hypothetical protein
LQQHEKVHLRQNVAKACCGTSGTFIPDYPGGKDEQNPSECEAYKASEKCLKENMIKDCGVSFDSGYNDGETSDCIEFYDMKIRTAEYYRKLFCGRAGIK